MPRPSSPLISHDAVVETSLRIIDSEGLDAFNLPRLARELNVQTPSLYHHFQDRADILRTVARAIVLESRVPDPSACRTWVDWFVGISMSFRRAVLNHRNAAPILLEFMPRDLLIWNYELGVQILAAVGVPPDRRILVIDGLDTLTLGASLAEAAKSPARAGQVFANVTADAEPMLAEALAVNTRSAEELFADAIRSFLRGTVPEVPPDIPAPRALMARYRQSRAAVGSLPAPAGASVSRPAGWPGESTGRRGAGGEAREPFTTRRSNMSCVNGVVPTTIIVAGLALAGYALVMTARNRRMSVPLLAALGVLEILLLVQVGIIVAKLASGERPASPATLIGYLIAMPLVPVAAAFWGLLERSRWGPAVVAVAGLVAAVLMVRLHQIWPVIRV